MNVKETIMWCIDLFDGSENAIIEETKSRCGVDSSVVEKNIYQLERDGFISRTMDKEKMNSRERSRFYSDECAIVQRIKPYNEAEWLNEKAEQRKKEEQLDIKDRFVLYFNKMVDEAHNNHPFSEYGFSWCCLNGVFKVTEKGSDFSIEINLNDISDLSYFESINEITYKINGKAFVLETRYLWNKILINNHIGY